MVKRASGTSTWLANSQASRLTSTTTAGGRAGCAPASRLFLKAGQSLFEETVAPFANDLARRIESCGDEIVAEPLGRQQDDLRADDVSIRRRIFAGSRFQRGSLVGSELDDVWAMSRRSSTS